jgi:hypothetical protein
MNKPKIYGLYAQFYNEFMLYHIIRHVTTMCACMYAFMCIYFKVLRIVNFIQ